MAPSSSSQPLPPVKEGGSKSLHLILKLGGIFFSYLTDFSCFLLERNF